MPPLPSLRRQPRWLVIAAFPFLLAGCGNFQLASSVQQVGKSAQQQQLDTLTCKDEANLAANTADRQVGAFLLGMTIIGTPIAFELEKQKKREVFAQCLTAKGYTVIPPNDDAKVAPPIRPTVVGGNTAPPQAITTPALVPVVAPRITPPPPAKDSASSEPAKAADDAGQLTKLKDLHDRGLITDAEYTTKRQVILDRL